MDDEDECRIWTVDVEVRVSPRSTARFDTIKSHVYSFLTTSFSRISLPSTLQGWHDQPLLASSLQQVSASSASCPYHSLPLSQVTLQIHIYQCSDADAIEEFSNGGSDPGDEVMAATVSELPNAKMEGLWDSLIFEGNVKMKLLDYIHATLVLSDADIDFNLVSWNRVVLLHGPPGTGKTSLCRALAQKLSIRLSHRYPQSRLLEINSHSLFSRWFSESGKLVQRLFGSINDLVEEDDCFVVVLIDEVESLTAARAGAMAGTEPSDGLRVVNALLTQLDKLKHRKNVLVMATSNLVDAIDSAFIDRADIIQYIDLPPCEAIYDILRSCLMEMVKKRVIKSVTVPTLKEAQMHELAGTAAKSDMASSISLNQKIALRLLRLAALCRKQGMSGRALRRLPVLALARYIGIGYYVSVPLHKAHEKGTMSDHGGMNGVNGKHGQEQGSIGGARAGADVEIWLDGMESAIKDSAEEVKRFG